MGGTLDVAQNGNSMPLRVVIAISYDVIQPLLVMVGRRNTEEFVTGLAYALANKCL